MMKESKGFTLIELMITLGIVIIITSMAVVIYSGYVRKGRRVDAINSLLSIALAEERYRSNNTLYGTLAQVWSGTTASAEGYYTLSITNVTATSYTLSAAAQGNQANDSESGTSCSTLTLAASNGAMTKTPSICWPK